MATARTVLQSIASQVSTVTAGIIVNGLAAPVVGGVGWPSTKVLQDIPKGATTVFGVFDRGGSRNTTRWPRIFAVPDVVTAAGISVASYTGGSPMMSTPAVLTLTGTPIANDAVVFQFGNFVGAPEGFSGGSVVVGYVSQGSDTLSTFATALAAQISTITGLSAVASAGVITITNTTGNKIYSTAAVGNQVLRTNEYNRISRRVGVAFWCPSEVYRQAITDVFESQLAQLRNMYGFQLANNEWVRVEYDHDIYIDDQQLQSVFRRDFFMNCEYGVTGTETAWPVLGGAFTLTVQDPTN